MRCAVIILPIILGDTIVCHTCIGQQLVGRGEPSESAQHALPFDVVKRAHPIDSEKRGTWIGISSGSYDVSHTICASPSTEPKLIRKARCL